MGKGKVDSEIEESRGEFGGRDEGGGGVGRVGGMEVFLFRRADFGV